MGVSVLAASEPRREVLAHLLKGDHVRTGPPDPPQDAVGVRAVHARVQGGDVQDAPLQGRQLAASRRATDEAGEGPQDQHRSHERLPEAEAGSAAPDREWGRQVTHGPGEAQPPGGRPRHGHQGQVEERRSEEHGT